MNVKACLLGLSMVGAGIVLADHADLRQAVSPTPAPGSSRAAHSAIPSEPDLGRSVPRRQRLPRQSCWARGPTRLQEPRIFPSAWPPRPW